MAKPVALHRLYRTKFTLLAVTIGFAGLALLVLATLAEDEPGFGWLAHPLAIEIGGGLFLGGLIGVLFHYTGRSEDREMARQQFRAVLREEAPAIREAVVDGFALEPDELTKVAAPATLDKVIENCLAIRLGDKAFAADIYADLREQAIRATERHFDKSISVSLAPWPHRAKRPMFVATVRYEYKVDAVPPTLRFACVSDPDEYRELLADPTTQAIYFEPIVGLDAGSMEVFQLAQFSVDGRALPTRRTARAGSQVHTVNLAGKTKTGNAKATISYTYRMLIQQHGHLFHIDVSWPTKGLVVRFNYGNCGIRHVNVLDYVASAHQPRLMRLPVSDPTPSIEVAFDGWVLPKAGVAFVWLLEVDLTRSNT